MVIELNLQDWYFTEQVNPVSASVWGQWLEVWLKDPTLAIPEAPAYELTLRLTNDQEIQELNAQYRQKNQPTDVLAFAALEAELPANPDLLSDEPLYLGDIIISVETANQQAHQLQHSLVYELAWLFSHGFLHLLGWDHPEENSLNKMLEQQDHLLTSLDLSSLN